MTVSRVLRALIWLMVNYVYNSLRSLLYRGRGNNKTRQKTKNFEFFCAGI
jgi:hypothetical protein